jgi:crossover junction endodeoxyribonuclease RuvC
MRRIIGIDPGLASVGWGILEYEGQHVVHIAHGCITTKAGVPQSQRLFSIYAEIKEVLNSYHPTEGAIETLYFARNSATALPVAEARGVICMALAEQSILVREFSPRAIKQAVVGRGSADKQQLQELIRLILGLEEIPTPDHAADALGAALCSAHTIEL